MSKFREKTVGDKDVEKTSKSKHGLHVAQENIKKKSGKTAFYGFLEAEKKDNAKNPIFPQPCHELLKRNLILKYTTSPFAWLAETHC